MPKKAAISQPARKPRAGASKAKAAAQAPGKPASPSAASSPVQFEGDVVEAVASVRRRLAAIVESVCGGRPRAQDITDRFGVYRKLGWQIWNVLYLDDALAAVRHLPNERTLKVWNEAAKAAGVDTAMLDRLGEAVANFQRSAEGHALDREMLEMLLESHGGDTDAEAAERWRKQAFSGNAFTWGVRAKVMFSCAVLFPAKARPDFMGMVRLQGLLGFMRTRPGVRWPFAQLLIRSDANTIETPGRSALLDSAALRETGVPLLVDYCSSPLPPIRRRRGSVATVEDELLPTEVGVKGAADVLTGEVIDELFTSKTAPGESATFGTGVRTPCELLISDLIVHKSFYPNASRELIVFSELMTPFSRDDRDRISVPEQIESMGNLADGIGTAELPRYGELLQTSLKRINHSAEEFEVFRVRMKYPPMPVSITIRHHMPVD